MVSSAHLTTLFAVLFAGAAQAQSDHVLIEPTNLDGTVPGVGNVPCSVVWKLGCVGDTASVDHATFLQAVRDAKAILAQSEQGEQVMIPPPGQQSVTGGFGLDFTLSGTPPPFVGGVQAVKDYLEARLGSSHASTTIPITVMFGSLPPGVLMLTSVGYTPAPYPIVRTNLENISAFADMDDQLASFLPPGPTVPVRFDGTSMVVTDAADVFVPWPLLTSTYTGVTPPPGPLATITVTNLVGWDFNPTDGTSPAGFCFRTAFLHEVVHALGFASDVDTGFGLPTVMDLFRFQRTANRPPLGDYMPFLTTARLVDYDTPDDDHALCLGSFEYPMADGAPDQGSHFRQQTPSVGVMMPSLPPGTTFYPNYALNSDLRVLDALGYDWDDPALEPLPILWDAARMDEDPNSSNSVRFHFSLRSPAGPINASTFTAGGFMSTGVTSVVAAKGSAARFDGTNWYEIPDFHARQETGAWSEPFTLECWIRPTVQPASGAPVRHVFSAGLPNFFGSGLRCYLDSSSRLRIEHTGGLNNFGPVLNDGNWHHVYFAYGGTSFPYGRLWVDYVDTGLFANMSMDLMEAPAYIGRAYRDNPAPEPFIGDIDGFRYFGLNLAMGEPTAVSATRPVGQGEFPALIVNVPFDQVGATTPHFVIGAEPLVYGSTAASVPTAVPGMVDGATNFVVTFATTQNSGFLYGQLIDTHNLRDLQSGAEFAGATTGNWEDEYYTMQHQSGSAYCEGQVCPCANEPTPGTWVGCQSSNGQGGRLRASGAQSITAGTLTLLGTQMTNSSALYFQGTTQAAGGAGTVFGDGLRCVAGSIIRLGTKSNVGGASQYPSAGDPSVAQKGLVTVPGTRHYQVWFRNAAAYCSPSTFNLTNGWTVNWTL